MSDTAQGEIFEATPVSIFGTFTTVMSSLESNALPPESLAMPGASAIASTSSRVRLLLSSASDPPRNTMTRSARALSARKVCLKPALGGKNRNEHRNHAGNTNHDDARCAEAIRQACHAHDAQIEPLPKYF